MSRRAATVTVLLSAALAVGCAPETPDYQSIWTTSSTTAATTTEPPVPFGKYLEDTGVSGEQVAPDSLTDLTVSIPTPPGWSKRQSPRLPPTTEAIGKDGTYPIALLAVFKLGGDFDAAEVVQRATADAELSQNFTRLDSSAADFHGFPSAMIQGSHDLDGQRLHSWFRAVIATGSAPAHQRYLVQLTITTAAGEAAAQADDVEAIIDGFTVTAP